MTYALRIRPAADADVDEAAVFIARDSEDQALRFYDSVDATYRLIREHPLLWPLYPFIDHPRLAGLRRRSVVGFPNHLVFFRLDAGTIEVIRVLHGARDISSILVRDLEADAS